MDGGASSIYEDDLTRSSIPQPDKEVARPASPDDVPMPDKKEFLQPSSGPIDISQLESSRLSDYEIISDEIRAKQATLQAMGIELQLEGNLKTRKDVEFQTKRVYHDMLTNNIRKQRFEAPKIPFPTPLPTYKRTKENNRIQRDLNKELFGNPLDARTQRPIVNRGGWNITRVNLGLGGTGV